MNKEKLIDIIDELLIECENDVFEYEDIEEDKAKLIYDNVLLYTLKLKEKIEEMLKHE